MRNTKKTATRKPAFNLATLNWSFDIEPEKWPMLEIHATAFWYGDTFPTPNPHVLTAGITRVIERAFRARSAKK